MSCLAERTNRPEWDEDEEVLGVAKVVLDGPIEQVIVYRWWCEWAQGIQLVVQPLPPGARFDRAFEGLTERS